jgi:hypothetical protein
MQQRWNVFMGKFFKEIFICGKKSEGNHDMKNDRGARNAISGRGESVYD